MKNVNLGTAEYNGVHVRVTLRAWYSAEAIAQELLLQGMGSDSDKRATKQLSSISVGDITIGELLGYLALADGRDMARAQGITLRASKRAAQPYSDAISVIAQDRDVWANTVAWAIDDTLRKLF